MGTHVTQVGPGSHIGKPTGPDLNSHLVASLGESLTLLDIEISPDSSLKAKDLVHCPDIRELFWRGWRVYSPLFAVLLSATISMTAISAKLPWSNAQAPFGYRRKPVAGDSESLSAWERQDRFFCQRGSVDSVFYAASTVMPSGAKEGSGKSTCDGRCSA